MAMTSSSLAPILRYRSSCRPAFASNDHLAPFFTMGTGNGQFPLPTMTKARFPFVGSAETLCFSRAWAAKSAARWGVSKLLGPATELAGAVASGFAAGSCPAQRNDAERHAQATAHAVQKSLKEVAFWDVGFISQIPVVWPPARSQELEARSSSSYLRRPPPPRPPPPRDPKLEEPRLLAARALDPLNPLEPPPKALCPPPLERDPVLLAPPPAARLLADSRAAAARSPPAAPPPAARSAERASRLADLSPARASWLAALSPVRASRLPALSPALA